MVVDFINFTQKEVSKALGKSSRMALVGSGDDDDWWSSLLIIENSDLWSFRQLWT